MAHIRKYDFEYSRRKFMEQTTAGAAGLATSGILTSLWPEILKAESLDKVWNKVYPEELYNIEAYTKGKIKTWDVINADNIDLVQDLVDPALYQEVKQDQREFFMLPTPTDIETMHPPYYLDATLKNFGRSKFDEVGNLWTDDGSPWIGGLPFPDPKTGNELIANLTYTWGQHDQSIFAIPTLSLNPEGDVQYEYDFVWCQENITGRVNPNFEIPTLTGKGREGKLRFQSVWFTHSNDVKGTAFLSIWPYDQREFPDLFGYLPAFKRVRRFPTNQRFEPLVAGMNLFLSDAWASGDPMLTWGNFKIVYRGPYIGAMHYNWLPDNDNYDYPLTGGKKGKTYLYVGKSLLPDVIVFEGEPTGYPRAPLSKRRIWMDASVMNYPQSISFDRRGEVWKTFEPGFGQYITGPDHAPHPGREGVHEKKAADGRTEWSWNWVISNDLQTGRVTRFHQAEHCRGGWKSGWDVGGDLINKYMTVQAMRRLGT